MERVGGGGFVSGGWASRNNAQGRILWEIKGWIIYASRPGLFHFVSRLAKSIKQTTVVSGLRYCCDDIILVYLHKLYNWWVGCDHLFILFLVKYIQNIGMCLAQDNCVHTLLQVPAHPTCLLLHLRNKAIHLV